MRAFFFVVVMATVIAGCSHGSAATDASAPPAVVEGKGWVKTKLTDCEHGSGACREIRDTAKATYLYAQLAQNAYAKDEYGLPAYVTEFLPIVENKESGFAARTYIVRKPGEPAYLVIAYRGTNFSDWRDWLFGNFPYDRQYKQGLAHLSTVRKQAPDMRIVLTGHSLGGAIATYVSLREPGVPIFIFNSSPRVSRGPGLVNERVAVSQYGEILAALRKPFINAGGTYTTINCMQGWHPVDRHTQRYLADCLTEIAAWEDADARASAETNGLGPLRRVIL